MRLFLFISALIATVTFIACDKNPDDTKEKTGTIELVFKGRYDGAPLPMFTNINTNASNPTALTFKKLEFFISEIKGTKEGKIIDFADVGYVSLNNLTNASQAEEGFKITLEDIPVGAYDNLQYGIGVPEDVNGKSPSDFTSDSPLGLNANHWSGWNSYIFCKVEGDAVSSTGSTSGFLYHGGVDGMYQKRDFDKTFTVSEGANTTLNFHIHGSELFFKAGQEIDVFTNNTTHSGAVGSTHYELAKKAITNLANALHID